MINKMFDVEATDDKTALINKLNIQQEQMKELANAAKQVVEVALNEIGDRKEIGGIIYELDEKGRRKRPIGTKL